jgi:hypothetical protein
MPGGVDSASRAARLRQEARLPASGVAPHGDDAAHGSMRSCVVALCWACAWSAPVFPAQLDYGVGLSATYESNMFRTTTDPRPELYESLMGAVNLSESNRDLNVRALAQVEHRHFTRQTFSDDTTGFLDGAALWTIVPQRVTWALEDTFREVQVNLTAPNTPGNLTKSNTLNTGPDLTFAIDSTNSAVVGGRYGRFDVQNSLSDNRRYGGYLRGVHMLSLVSKISLNYETWHVSFEPEATPFPKVLQQNWYGHYESLYAGSGAAIDLGRTRVTQYGGQSLDGNLGRLTLIKAFGPDSSFRISYSDEISDTYSDLLRGVTLAAVPADPAAVIIQGLATADVYHSKLGSIAYANQGGRFQYTLVGLGRKIDFATLDQDYDERGGRIYLNWRQSGVLQFVLSGYYSKRTYLTLDREDTDRDTLASAEYRVNSNIAITLLGDLIRRDSTAPGVSYVDRRVLLLAGFTIGRGLQMQSRR